MTNKKTKFAKIIAEFLEVASSSERAIFLNAFAKSSKLLNYKPVVFLQFISKWLVATTQVFGSTFDDFEKRLVLIEHALASVERE